MSLTIHPRHWIVERAYLDIDSAVSEALKKHRDITYLELMQCLNRVMASWLKSGVKGEWYPDEGEKKPGGLK